MQPTTRRLRKKECLTTDADKHNYVAVVIWEVIDSVRKTIYKFCKLYTRIPQKMRQDETSCFGDGKEAKHKQIFYWDVLHVHLTTRAHLVTLSDSVLTVSLPTRDIHHKIWLKILLIAVIIVFIRWQTRRLAVLKEVGFFPGNQQTTKQASKDPSSGNPKAAKITVASSAESNQFWQSRSGTSVGGDVKELYLVWTVPSTTGLWVANQMTEIYWTEEWDQILLKNNHPKTTKHTKQMQYAQKQSSTQFLDLGLSWLRFWYLY